MSKETISATVDPEIAEYLDQEGRNRSQTINKAVRQYMEAGGNELAMINLRIEQLRSQQQTLRSELESVSNQLEEVEQRKQEILQEQETERQETWNQALSMLSFEELSATNTVQIASKQEAIEDFAADLDMSVANFKSELKQRYKEQ